jgi:hypothetical protein
MAGSKDHTKISTTNIIKPAMEALPADDQRPFEDLVMRDEKEVMRQWNEQRDKEEAELLHKLSERRKEAADKYLSHFTVDRHQKIVRQGEIDMESLLPPLQGPAVSTPDLSLTQTRLSVYAHDIKVQGTKTPSSQIGIKRSFWRNPGILTSAGTLSRQSLVTGTKRKGKMPRRAEKTQGQVSSLASVVVGAGTMHGC